MNAPAKSLAAGSLRQRIAIEQPVVTQNGLTGEMLTVWAEIARNVPASVQPVSGSEFIAAAKVESTITARIKIRFRPNLNAAMRIRHGETIYAIKAILADPNTGREWLTLLVESK